MPTLAQMQAATPKCPRPVQLTYPGGQTVQAFRCGRPCRYIAARNIWQCPSPYHGDVYAGEVLGALLNGDLDLEDLPLKAVNHALLFGVK